MPHGEVGVREFMIGVMAVGIFAGVVLGRNTERARRSYRDQAAGRTAFEKYRRTALAEARRAAVTVVIVGVVLVAIFVGLINYGSRG
jgi:ABC-type Fe3+ transport system permease subunit